MGYCLAFEQDAEFFRLLDRDCAHKHRTARLVKFFYLVDHGVVFLALRAVDHVRVFSPDELLIGRDDHHFELVNLVELLGFCFRRSGHPGQLRIHPEIVLKGDRRQGLVLSLDLDVLFCFEGLVETVAVPASRHQAAGEFIYNEDFTVLHHVVHVPLEEQMRLQSLVGVMHPVHILGLKEISYIEELFRLFHSLLGEVNRTRLFVYLIVHVAPEFGDDSIHLVVLVRGLFGGT